MTAIKTYNDILYELRTVQARFSYLKEKREELYTRYISPNTMTVDLVGGQNMPKNNDLVFEYIKAVTTPDEKTGLSIDEELEVLTREMNSLSKTLLEMTTSLMNLKGVEYALYVEIVVNCQKVSEAVAKVAEANGMSERNVWKNYYPKIKEYLRNVNI